MVYILHNSLYFSYSVHVATRHHQLPACYALRHLLPDWFLAAAVHACICCLFAFMAAAVNIVVCFHASSCGNRTFGASLYKHPEIIEIM